MADRSDLASTTLSALYTAHRSTSVARAIGLALLAPFAAVAIGATIALKEGLDSPAGWMTYVGVVMGVIAFIAVAIACCIKVSALLHPCLYIVVGHVGEPTLVPADGLLALSDVEHRAAKLDVRRCSQFDKRGVLNESAHWRGPAELPGPTEVVDKLPVDCEVALLCRHDGRVLQRMNDSWIDKL